MKRIFALILSFALLLSCLVLPAGAMFDPSPVYQVQAQSEALAMLAEDPLLQAPEHALLAAQVQQMFDKAGAMN